MSEQSTDPGCFADRRIVMFRRLLWHIYALILGNNFHYVLKSQKCVPPFSEKIIVISGDLSGISVIYLQRHGNNKFHVQIFSLKYRNATNHRGNTRPVDQWPHSVGGSFQLSYNLACQYCILIFDHLMHP